MTESFPFAASKSDQPGRLEALRARLAAQKLDGFFIPVSDRYLNEYVPPCAMRLAWLTGFTGSAGMGVVLKDHAALAVDGRYTLQAAREVESSLFELRHYLRAPLTDFLREHVKAGAVIGYDPWLHTELWLEKVNTVVRSLGAKMTPVGSNPFDAIWQSAPPPPRAPVFPHPPEFAGESSASKRERLAASLKKDRIAAAVIASPVSVAWLLNMRGGDVEGTPLPLSHALLHDSGKVDWFIDPAKCSEAVRLAAGEDVTLVEEENFIPTLRALGRGGRKFRVNPATTPLAVIHALTDAGAGLDRGDDPCELPRACKNAVEIAGMRAAHRRDGLALTRFLFWLQQAAGTGVDELQAEEKLLEFRRENPEFLYPSFHAISGAGPNGAVVHYRGTAGTNRGLKPGELYLIDSGGQYRDGTTDVTRTVAIGAVSDEMKRNVTRVLKGHVALASIRFPAGVTGAQLDVLARQYLWRAGLDFDHGTGHGVGAFLGVHEGPQSISARGQAVLQPGMVLSNEPGYYKKNAYGVRIENLVAVRESAVMMDDKPMLEFETLTLAPIDRNAIDAEMLTADEKSWLDEYHRNVYAAHESRLGEDERRWLRAATAAVELWSH